MNTKMHFSHSAVLFALLVPFATSSSHSTSISWGNCTSNDPPNLSCGELSVPVNWDEPNGEHITIAMARISAIDTQNKIGSMLFNPGGPGVSALDIIVATAEEAQGNVTIFPPQFDVIGPDTRGSGASNPIKCDPSLWNQVVQNEPTDEASFQKLVTHNRKLGESCRDLTGPLVEYMDTASVAKDFDAIRAALGEEKLTYLGLSYGTVIGQAYAELFPENIRAFALDGNLDHALSPTAALALKAYAYEDVFQIFATWCESTAGCPLKGENVTKIFNDLIAQVEKAPIPAPYCQNSGTCDPSVTSSFDLRYNFQGLLNFKQPPSFLGLTTWFDAATALKQAAAGNATLLSSPRATSPNSTVFPLSGLATLCLDWNHTATSLADLVYIEQMTADITPITGGVSTQWYLQSSCIGWPAPVRYIPHTIEVTGIPPILLTNAYHDPETPYTEANSLMAQLKGSVLATRNGDGHTSYYLLGETYKAINEYLVTGKTPPPNTVFNS